MQEFRQTTFNDTTRMKKVKAEAYIKQDFMNFCDCFLQNIYNLFTKEILLKIKESDMSITTAVNLTY